MSAGFFVTLYMQLVLGYGPLDVGLALLPSNVVMAAVSLFLSSRLLARYGIHKPLGVGLALGAVGLALLARTPLDGEIARDVLPGMILLGLSAGIVSIPMTFASLAGIAPRDTGLVSGVVNTVSMIAGAIGLAILAQVSSTRTNTLLEAGASMQVALTGGYRSAFLVGAVCAGAAALVGAFLPKNVQDSRVGDER